MTLNSNLSAWERFAVISHFEECHFFVSNHCDVVFDRMHLDVAELLPDVSNIPTLSTEAL